MKDEDIENLKNDFKKLQNEINTNKDNLSADEIADKKLEFFDKMNQYASVNRSEKMVDKID